MLDIDGPRVRMGVLWFVISCTACLAGTSALAFVLAVVAFAAASQASAAWRRAHGTQRAPYGPVVIGGAVLVTLGAIAGPVGMGAALLIALVACLVVGATPLGGRRYDALLSVALIVVVGISAASIVLVRQRFGFAVAVVLLADVHLIEGSNFLIGAGARHRWEGPVAGAAAVAAMSLAAAAVLAPPLRGASPWVLGAAAIACTGAGRRLTSAVLPDPDAAAPALRRLDGFLVTGLVWFLLATALLDSPRF